MDRLCQDQRQRADRRRRQEGLQGASHIGYIYSLLCTLWPAELDMDIPAYTDGPQSDWQLFYRSGADWSAEPHLCSSYYPLSHLLRLSTLSKASVGAPKIYWRTESDKQPYISFKYTFDNSRLNPSFSHPEYMVITAIRDLSIWAYWSWNTHTVEALPASLKCI